MAPSHSNNTHLEAAKLEQIITEFFAKSLHIILESRSLNVSSRNSCGDPTLASPSSSSSSSSSVRPRDKWFNLALRECPAALENIDIWRQSNLEPIVVVVDVILVQKHLDWDPVSFSPKRSIHRSSSTSSWNTAQEELGIEAKSEKIIERWIMQYESRKTRDSISSSRRSSNISLHSLYKKLLLLLRSLYATVRLLPGHKIFRDLNSSGQIRSFTLSHRVSSSFTERFTCKDETEMQKFGFTPVDTSCGRLCLSVKYCPSVPEVNSEPSSTPISPRVITDYVGSPLAEPLRSFPSGPTTGLPSQGSTSSLLFSRRHSWSFDHCRPSSPSIISSPSPTYSEPHTSVSNVASRRFPPTSLPPHPPEMYLVQKNKTFDEYYPSPYMSPSPSPSPPIYSYGPLLSKALVRSESAPVSIPTADVTTSGGNSNVRNLPSSPPIRGSRYTSRTDRGVNMMQTGATAEKLFSLGRDESRKYYATNTSFFLPQISFSRNSSRSCQDEYDDSDFSCPFEVDDDDMTDLGSRAESFDHGHITDMVETGGLYPIRKSQDAAVGALVHMLQKAPPLREDSCTPGDSSPSINTQEQPNQILEASTPATASIVASGLLTRKTTSDALEEFQGYREMKNLLLLQGSKSQI
ncbi:autophagy-related protein 13b-like [Senna tora]|uniref:Autophagy-related protein 13b-like n=1 Tax=Senna tora TaxID=362788 RepID=A0A835C9F2_9FABA|nr:autophagy-related protein 13b-like [Senna tora]